MKQSFIYSIKVWLTAVFVAPALIIGIQTLQHNYSLTNGIAYYVGVVVGGLYSVPSAVLLYLTVYLANRFYMGQIRAKILLTFAGGLLTLLAMVLSCGGLPSIKEVFYTEVYASVIVAGVWFYKLKMVERQPVEVSVN